MRWKSFRMPEVPRQERAPTRAIREVGNGGTPGITSADERAQVASACEILQVHEFRLFEIAHRRWFGCEADVKALERVFVAWLYGARAPAWVRHTVRLVLDDAAGDGERAAARDGEREVARACNEIMFALVFAAAYAIWVFGG